MIKLVKSYLNFGYLLHQLKEIEGRKKNEQGERPYMAMAKQRFTKIISSIPIVISSLLFLAQAGKDFDFPCINQSNQDNIAFRGNANPSDNIIYLTNSIYNENFNWNLGWAVYKDPIRLWRKHSKQLG